MRTHRGTAVNTLTSCHTLQPLCQSWHTQSHEICFVLPQPAGLRLGQCDRYMQPDTVVHGLDCVTFESVSAADAQVRSSPTESAIKSLVHRSGLRQTSPAVEGGMNIVLLSVNPATPELSDVSSTSPPIPLQLELRFLRNAEFSADRFPKSAAVAEGGPQLEQVACHRLLDRRQSPSGRSFCDKFCEACANIHTVFFSARICIQASFL